jgi:hypothetical protein
MVRIMQEQTTQSIKKTYAQTEEALVKKVLGLLDGANSEVIERNQYISERDEFVYGKRLEKSLNIPLGHDRTPINWLKRGVEIHRDQFMGRGFQVVSTYNSQDVNAEGDGENKTAAIISNKNSKLLAEERQRAIQAMIDDNGGPVMFQDLAESASAIGSACIKMYYDTEEKKIVFSPIESVENIYVVWSRDDFRKPEGVGYVYQMSKRSAISEYGVSNNVATSPLGQPTKYLWNTSSAVSSQQPMVTFVEYSGFVDGFAGDNGKVKEVEPGEETEINLIIVGNEVVQLITDRKKIPKYYIFPNRRVRRRPWGISDLSDAAIGINLTYIETLSDWRTVASKVNFPKIKAFGFPAGTELPKPKPRTSEMIPLADGQDLQTMDQGDANHIDFRAQLEELKEQFVRETGISRVFFDDPSVTLNSNQALITSIKPTTDIAEAKKSLWSPILVQMFKEALEVAALHDQTIKPLVDDENFINLKIMWPSTMQRDDPIYIQNLLNRFNANTISLQSLLEAMGDSKEELDRIRDEMENPTTGAILAKSVGNLYQMRLQAGMQQAGMFLNPDAADPNQGQGADMRQQTSTQDTNVPGAGIMSQPGSGATPVSPGGAVNQNAQQNLGA